MVPQYGVVNTEVLSSWVVSRGVWIRHCILQWYVWLYIYTCCTSYTISGVRGTTDTISHEKHTHKHTHNNTSIETQHLVACQQFTLKHTIGFEEQDKKKKHPKINRCLTVLTQQLLSAYVVTYSGDHWHMGWQCRYRNRSMAIKTFI